MAQVYCMHTDALKNTGEFSAVLQTLSPARQEKIRLARRERDKRLLLGAGFLLNYALRQYGLCERDAAIVYGADGKPYLADRNDLYFSLSHSGSIALCAVSDQEIGADAEAIRPVRDALIRRACSAEEYAALPSAEPARTQAFFRLWTAKESYLKWRGTGLRVPPASVTLLRGGALCAPEDGLFFRQYAFDGGFACVCGRDPDLPEAPTWVRYEK